MSKQFQIFETSTAAQVKKAEDALATEVAARKKAETRAAVLEAKVKSLEQTLANEKRKARDAEKELATVTSAGFFAYQNLLASFGFEATPP